MAIHLSIVESLVRVDEDHEYLCSFLGWILSTLSLSLFLSITLFVSHTHTSSLCFRKRSTWKVGQRVIIHRSNTKRRSFVRFLFPQLNYGRMPRILPVIIWTRHKRIWRLKTSERFERRVCYSDACWHNGAKLLFTDSRITTRIRKLVSSNCPEASESSIVAFFCFERPVPSL